jgi:dCTP deaminase
MIVNGIPLIEAAPIKDMLSTKEREHGVSYGLAEAGYDIRIKQNITFVPEDTYQYVPFIEADDRIGFARTYFDTDSVVLADPVAKTVKVETGRFCIASAIEEFQMPNNLLGRVCDKSTWARRGLSVFNTVIEPGWNGFLTLELVYHGQENLHIPAGAGIAQVLFSRVAVPASYAGKYQNQQDRPVEAIYEKG